MSLGYDLHKQQTLFQCSSLTEKRQNICWSERTAQLCMSSPNWKCISSNKNSINKNATGFRNRKKNLHHEPIKQGACRLSGHSFIHSHSWCITKQEEKVVVDIFVVFPNVNHVQERPLITVLRSFILHSFLAQQASWPATGDYEWSGRPRWLTLSWQVWQ